MAQQSSFLKQVAQAFYNNGKHNLRDYCFIFPNRRSSIFFEKELIACSDKEPFILPSITTISDFVCGITTIVECGRIEQLLDLYDEYCKLAGNNAEPFDEFSHWGEIILSDFNDIDLYLVDAEKIFTNIKEYKEIDTDYLTDEQKSALREYFGDAYPLNENDMSGFWKHTNAYNDSSKKDYFRLWEILGNLYKQFNSRLEAKGLAYSGHIYRKAVDILKSIKAEQLPFSQYVFVGFNVLSTSELQIFTNIALPLCKNAIFALTILLFIDYWNMVEQPLVLLTDTAKQPLSVFLSQINEPELGIAFAASSVYMIPPLLIFFWGEDYLVEGISRSGIK